MSKFYCERGHKWCKFCHNIKKSKTEKIPVCTYCQKEIENTDKCPRLAEIETVRFSEMIRNIDFDKAFAHLINWWPDQEPARGKYLEVFNKLCKMKPNWHKLGDLMIAVDKEYWDGKIYPNVSGRYPNIDQNFGIEFIPWIEWVSMYFTEETLASFTCEEIIGACLWEMTFNGFDENTIRGTLTKMRNNIEEMRDEDVKSK
jgi:hypothetical protein